MAYGIKRVKNSDLELTDRLVSIQRVTKVTKGGRTFSFFYKALLNFVDKALV